MHWNVWSHNDPLSLFTRDDRDGVDSHMSPSDVDKSGSGGVKWSPAHAEAIETGNGGRCGVMASKLSNLRILYFPQFLTHPPSSRFTLTHTHTQECTPFQYCRTFWTFIPWGVSVWYQPICSNQPHNPNSGTSTTPGPRSSSPLIPQCVPQRSDCQTENTLQRARAGPALVKKVREEG